MSPHLTFIAALLSISAWNASAQTCARPELSTVSVDHPECLFFSGTAQFREKNYAAALKEWEKLLALKSVEIEDQHLQISAMNNSGYLHYSGLGTKINRARARELWDVAYSRGHNEAAYHLCHFYADSKQPEYDAKLGHGYCTEALRRYTFETDKADTQVTDLVKEYLSNLPPK